MQWSGRYPGNEAKTGMEEIKTQSPAHPLVGTLLFHFRFDGNFLEILCTRSQKSWEGDAEM